MGAASLVSRGEYFSSGSVVPVLGDHEPSHLLPQVETNFSWPVLSRTADGPGIRRNKEIQIDGSEIQVSGPKRY